MLLETPFRWRFTNVDDPYVSAGLEKLHGGWSSEFTSDLVDMSILTVPEESGNL
jgi:hypothetical protein